MKPRILCVDDEKHILSGVRLSLRADFEVTVCDDPVASLELLGQGEPFAVILSDMRMPSMNGAQLLAKARERSPDTTRVLLTGFSEIEAAAAAINDGQVFRFLTKPCAPPDLRRHCLDALRQHRLVTAEKVLLEQTLRGAINTLTELLSLANPTAFGRAMRIKRKAVGVATLLAYPEVWLVEVAAVLSHIGYLTLPDDVVDKIQTGAALGVAERASRDRLPSIADQLLAGIPRLDDVRAVIRAGTSSASQESIKPEHVVAAKILAIVDEADKQCASGTAVATVVRELSGRQDAAGRSVVDALARFFEVEAAAKRRTVPLAKLRPGMVLAADLSTRAGVLLLRRGSALAYSQIACLLRVPSNEIEETAEVEVAEPAAPAAVGG